MNKIKFWQVTACRDSPEPPPHQPSRVVGFTAWRAGVVPKLLLGGALAEVVGGESANLFEEYFRNFVAEWP
jgi:hypothetical protein